MLHLNINFDLLFSIYLVIFSRTPHIGRMRGVRQPKVKSSVGITFSFNFVMFSPLHYVHRFMHKFPVHLFLNSSLKWHGSNFRISHRKSIIPRSQ